MNANDDVPRTAGRIPSSIPMNLVGADVRRLILSRAKEVRASSRRLLRFRSSTRDNFVRGFLSLIPSLVFCALLAGASASGQGWVYFANRVDLTPGVDEPVSGCSGLLLGTGYTAQLFGGSAGTADINLMALTPKTTFQTTPAQAGYVISVAVVVPSVAPGQIARLQMRVWDNRGGTVTSWQAATNYPTVQSGTSPSFDSPPLTSLTTSEPVILTGLQSFSICPLRLSAPVPLGNGVFSIRVTGAPGQSYVIQTASNLEDWLPLFTVTNVSGTNQFNVTNAPPLPARFYRARVAP